MKTKYFIILLALSLISCEKTIPKEIHYPQIDSTLIIIEDVIEF